MDCSQSLSETSASVRRAGEPAAVSGEPVSKGYVQSRSSQSLLLFQEDADGASPTGSTLNQACSHASGFIMVQSDHTYAGPGTEASASSLEPGTAGVAATLSASADLSQGAPFSSSPLSYEAPSMKGGHCRNFEPSSGSCVTATRGCKDCCFSAVA
ncbi:uncharacterized protein LOC144096752 [Amblyomma americanum]